MYSYAITLMMPPPADAIITPDTFMIFDIVAARRLFAHSAADALSSDFSYFAADAAIFRFSPATLSLLRCRFCAGFSFHDFTLIDMPPFSPLFATMITPDAAAATRRHDYYAAFDISAPFRHAMIQLLLMLLSLRYAMMTFFADARY